MEKNWTLISALICAHHFQIYAGILLQRLQCSYGGCCSAGLNYRLQLQRLTRSKWQDETARSAGCYCQPLGWSRVGGGLRRQLSQEGGRLGREQAGETSLPVVQSRGVSAAGWMCGRHCQRPMSLLWCLWQGRVRTVRPPTGKLLRCCKYVCRLWTSFCFSD